MLFIGSIHFHICSSDSLWLRGPQLAEGDYCPCLNQLELDCPNFKYGILSLNAFYVKAAKTNRRLMPFVFIPDRWRQQIQVGLCGSGLWYKSFNQVWNLLKYHLLSWGWSHDLLLFKDIFLCNNSMERKATWKLYLLKSPKALEPQFTFFFFFL